jgi:DNA-binding transcriptional regulator PaaX
MNRRQVAGTYSVPVPPESPELAAVETAAAANQPRQLIVTVYGLYSRETGNWLSVSSVVRLLGQLGVEEIAVRASISRLKRRGILVSSKMNGALAFGDLHDKVAQWWDLEQLHDLYADFLSGYEPLRARNKRRRNIPPREVFIGYVHALTTWRRLPYLDPGLPLELLPPDWNGAIAADLFDWLQRTLAEPAHDYARSVIDGTGG